MCKVDMKLHQRVDAFKLRCWKRLLRVPWTSRRFKRVNPKENQSWIFTGRTDTETETPVLWPPDVKSWLFGKDPDAGKDWGQEEKGMTEDETVGWHHRLDGHEFEQAPGVGDRQGGLECCSPWGHKESDMTEQLNWTELIGLMQGLDDSVYVKCLELCLEYSKGYKIFIERKSLRNLLLTQGMLPFNRQ